MESFDLVILGAGPAGYVGALRAAQLGMKVALIEQDQLGGTCLNVGCIPSKTLLFASERFAWMRHQGEHWGTRGTVQPELSTMMSRKQEVVQGFRDGIAALCARAKVSNFKGRGHLLGGGRVGIEGRDAIEGRWILLATGSEPVRIPSAPVDEERIVTSTGALSLAEVPKRLAVLGAGVIGVELGSVYGRLGSKVSFIEATSGICPGLDDQIATTFQKILETQGLEFRLSTRLQRAERQGEEVRIELDGGEILAADVLLVAVGRRPRTEGIGLDAVGLKPDSKGRLPVNGDFHTGCENIYAVGDLIDGPMLAHKASEEAVACVEALTGLRHPILYPAIPNVIYTDPEVASVGLTEQQARSMSLQVRVGTFPFKANSRARCCGETAGLVKVVGDSATGRLWGLHIVGSHASELIAQAVLAVQQGSSVEELARLPIAHPTLSEALKEACMDALGRAIHK
jgi:dihydrolipoamide dehydrogenase